MDLKGLGSLISKEAPLLGAVISSVNPVAGVIVSLIAKLFNANPSNIDDIATNISADPDAAIKLKQLQLDHESILYRAQVDDRSNARDREEQIIKLTGKRDYILDFIAIFVLLGYFVMCGVVAYARLDQSDHDVLYMMVGQLTSGFVMILSYYFGSSKIQQ